MNDTATRTSLVTLLVIVVVLFALILLSPPVLAQSKCREANNLEMCKLPQLSTDLAEGEDGYVIAKGTWTPDGLMDNADIQIECLRASLPQLSKSRIGNCKLVSGFIFHGMAAVSMEDYGIVAWERTKIIAERDPHWQMQNCENQQLVLDFLTNTVTLTSTLSRSSGHCAEMMDRIDKSRKEQHKPSQKESEVFSLVHNLGALYADEDYNPFFNKKR